MRSPPPDLHCSALDATLLAQNHVDVVKYAATSAIEPCVSASAELSLSPQVALPPRVPAARAILFGELDIPMYFCYVFYAAAPGSFLGACIDTGASPCVIGCKQELFFCAESLQQHRPARLGRHFRFGKGIQTSTATVRIRFPTTDGAIIPIIVGVVSDNTPFILRLGVMTECSEITNRPALTTLV